MKAREIRRRAREMGLTLESSSKMDLIRAIQSAEGNPQCFQTGRTSCDQTECCWMEDCIPEQHAQQERMAGIGARTGKWRT